MNDSNLVPNPEPEFEPNPDPVAVTPVAPAHPSDIDPAVGNQARTESVRRQNRIALIGTIALAVVLAFGGGLLVGRATAPGGSGGPADPAASQAPIPTALASSGVTLPSDGSRLGRADAKVTIVYWADYQCPYCAKFAQQVIPQLTSRIQDGTVALVHRDYAFIGEESVDAAVAVRCASREGKFWPMHDAVYAAQNGENKGGFARARLAQIAASVGLDATKYAACMDEREPLVDVLDDTSAGVRTGIESTPTIDVNGTRFLGVPDIAALTKAIDAALAGASPAPLPTAKPANDPWTAIPTDGRSAGNAAAPVTVELWMDYQSKESAAVANTLEPELRTRITSGAIRAELRDLAVLGDESAVAAAMIRCVSRQGGATWFVSDILAVSGQGTGAGIFTAPNLLRLSSQLGLEVKTLDTCLADPAIAADTRAETAQGTALGLKAGPTVLIKVGERETNRFSGVLDDKTIKAILAAIDAAK